jgi:hypothetical protein
VHQDPAQCDIWGCHSSEVKYLCLPRCCCMVLLAKQFVMFQHSGTTVPWDVRNNLLTNTPFFFSSKILFHVYQTKRHHIPEDSYLHTVTAMCVHFSLCTNCAVRWRGNPSHYYQTPINKHCNLKITKYCNVSNLNLRTSNYFLNS